MGKAPYEVPRADVVMACHLFTHHPIPAVVLMAWTCAPRRMAPAVMGSSTAWPDIAELTHLAPRTLSGYCRNWNHRALYGRWRFIPDGRLVDPAVVGLLVFP